MKKILEFRLEVYAETPKDIPSERLLAECRTYLQGVLPSLTEACIEAQVPRKAGVSVVVSEVRSLACSNAA